jgi:exodeoxyribonuclease V gamma subunit
MWSRQNGGLRHGREQKPMLSIVFSNRFENLLAALLERLGAERGGPFARHQVLVPGSAARRAIELAIAEREGICANVDFAYLGEWLWAQAGKLVEVAARPPYSPAVLTWRIFVCLAGNWMAAHPRLDAYCRKADARMRHELAERLARLFDHYLSYRPWWLEAWSAGKSAFAARSSVHDDEAWQAELWRQIDEGLPLIDFLRRAKSMDGEALATHGLPPSVHVFAPPGAPPRDIALLRALARAIDVHLYVLDPCREYWLDIVDARRMSWLAARQRDLFTETRRGLLEAWGKQTQAFIELLLDGENEMLEEERFAPHPGHHLLAQVHNAILDLEAFSPGRFHLDEEDRSIELHLCHSRIRELEVLHDRLLALLRDSPSLAPGEIAVLTPDLAACAPLIEAVFGAASRERRIPWRITGLGGTMENPVAQVLDRLLALVAGRMPAGEVFDFLRQPLVAARFGFDEVALGQVRDWLDGAGVRWGLDAEDVSSVGAASGHTLEEGFARLFLSWAAGEAARGALFAGHTGALAAPENDGGEILGRFWRFAETLRRHRATLRTEHSAEDWRAILSGALTDWVGETERAEDPAAVRAAINAFADDMAAGLRRHMVGLDVVRPALLACLDETLHGGVPGGKVTFSALPTLRGLPYRVICVIGLDRDAFPGRERPDEFDLIATGAKKEKGDRQRRLDDRNLFLDVMLAARDVLHLSCIGRGARDNTALPPSVVVDELFEALATACAREPRPEEVEKVKARLTVVHPLQAFSADYFAACENVDKRLESFRGDYAAALARRPGEEQRRGAAAGNDDDDDESGGSSPCREDFAAVHPFFPAPLAAPAAEWRRVDLGRLQWFFIHPCRFLLRERLGMELAETEDELADAEPFVANWPAQWTLAERLRPVLTAGDVGEKELLALARSGGEFPAGVLGESALRREIGKLIAHYRRLRAMKAAPRLPAHVVKLDFELDRETWSVDAAFGELGAEGMVYHRYDDARARDYLSAWIAHLVLCAAPPAGMACVTRGLARDRSFTLRPLPTETALRELEALLRLYRQGLSTPLRFFPKSAWARVFDGRDEGNAIQKARERWEGRYPEAADPAYRLALRGVGDALDDDFHANALKIFGALVAYLDDEQQ